MALAEGSLQKEQPKSETVLTLAHSVGPGVFMLGGAGFVTVETSQQRKKWERDTATVEVFAYSDKLFGTEEKGWHCRKITIVKGFGRKTKVDTTTRSIWEKNGGPFFELHTPQGESEKEKVDSIVL